MTQTPVPGSSGIQEPEKPAIGAPESDVISDVSIKQPSLDVALKELERVKADLKRVHAESASHRQKLKAFEDAEQAAKDAQLSEVERLNKQYADLQASNEDLAAALMEMNVNSEIARYANKLNFIIDSPELLAQMLPWKEIEWDEESGRPTNIEKLLEQLAKTEKRLVQQQQSGVPSVPAMNPGRSSIMPPGQGQPGKPPRLTDPGMWKK